jgi:hypothetical protein
MPGDRPRARNPGTRARDVNGATTVRTPDPPVLSGRDQASPNSLIRNRTRSSLPRLTRVLRDCGNSKLKETATSKERKTAAHSASTADRRPIVQSPPGSVKVAAPSSNGLHREGATCTVLRTTPVGAYTCQVGPGLAMMVVAMALVPFIPRPRPRRSNSATEYRTCRRCCSRRFP